MERTLASVVLFLIFASVVTVGAIGGSAGRVAAQGVDPEARTPKTKFVISPRSLNLGKKVSEAATGQFTMSAQNGTFAIIVNSPSGKGAVAYHIVSGGGSHSLQPGAVATVRVLFEPLSRGNFEAKIPVIYSFQMTTERGVARTITKNINVALHGSAVGPVPTPTATPTFAPTATPTETPTPSATPTAAPFEGHVDGGSASVSDPIVGASVTLYATGSDGYASGGNALGTVNSDSSGNFSFSTGSFACPEVDLQTYIVTAGGVANSVGSGTNSAIGMIALSGPCNNLGASTFVTINPLTTIATEWAWRNSQTRPELMLVPLQQIRLV